MIGFLRGKILLKQPPRLLIDVNGVGYEVDATMSTFYGLPEVGQQTQLYTHLAVSENSQTLYGFSSAAEKEMFRQLIKVSGIGSRSALTILSGISVQDFIYCVQNEDAARINIDNVVSKPGEPISVERNSSSPRQEATDALLALGYKFPEITRLIKTISNDSTLSTEEIIRLALQSSVKK